MKLQTYAKIGICVGKGASVYFSIMETIGVSENFREN